jgi:Mg-chelatase subunit ChlD
MQLNPDQISLISFTNTATTHNQLTFNGTAVKSSIDGLSANGTTYIGAGIIAAQNELFSVRGNSSATKTIIVLSDGIDTTGPAGGTQSAADAAKAAGIRIVSIAWGSANTTVMQALASSGADYYAAPTAAQLDLVYDSIAGSICRLSNLTIPITLLT